MAIMLIVLIVLMVRLKKAAGSVLAIALSILALAACLFYLNGYEKPKYVYKSAEARMAEGKYVEVEELFASLKDFRDAEKRTRECEFKEKVYSFQKVSAADEKKAIEDAEAAYASLSEETRAKVTEEVRILEETRRQQEERLRQQEEREKKQQNLEKADATILAKQIITHMARIYKNPLQMKILNIWAYKDFLGTWRFTFELSLTNDLGVAEAEYYGMTYRHDTDLYEIMDADIRFYATLGRGVYWVKDDLTAMRDNRSMELDASDIQAHFLKNYK